MSLCRKFIILTILCLALPYLAWCKDAPAQISEDDEILMVDPDAEAEVTDSVDVITKMPAITHFVDAKYPIELSEKGIEGVVGLDLLVNEKGTVDSVAVVQSVHPILDSLAMEASRGFTFTPALMNDTVPVAVLLRYEYRFSLLEVVAKKEAVVNFSGKLLEKGSRRPLADAMVVLTFSDTLADTTLGVPFSVYRNRLGKFTGQYLEEDRLVTITDSLGKFQFFSLPSCSVSISVPLAGYEEFHEREQILNSELTEATFYIPAVSYSDFEVVVYGKNEEKEISKRKLTLNEVKKVPGIGGDAVKIVQALPGVARPTFGGAEIVVRGSNTDDSRFFLDGVEIPLLFHFGGLKSTYNSDALESVDFYPGGFGTRYGGAIGGVVEITGRKPKSDRWHGYIDANFMDGSVLAEGPLGKDVSTVFSARRSFIGDIIGAVAKNYSTANILTTAPYYYDYLWRTDFNVKKAGHVYTTFFGVKDGLKLISSQIRGGSKEVDDATNSFNMETLFHMGLIGWDVQINKVISNSLRYGLVYGKIHQSFFGIFKVDEIAWMNNIRDQLTIAPSEKLKFNVGVDMQIMPVDLYMSIPSGDNGIQNDTTKNWVFGVVGAYLNLDWRPIKNLLIIPGIRYDYYPELIYSGAVLPEYWQYNESDFPNNSGVSGEPSLRLTTRYDVVPAHTLKFAAGNYSQTPKPLGQTIHPSWGDPSLPATRASQYVIGWEWRLTDLFHTDVQGYINRQWDVPRTPSKSEIADGALPYIHNGKKRMYGLEVMLKHEPSEHFFGWIAYSLSRAEEYDYVLREYVVTGKDQTHNFIGVGSLKLPKHWEAGLRLQYTTGDPQTPVIGSEYIEQYHYFQRIMGKKNSTRLDPTFQLDLRVDKKFVFKKWMASVYIDFFNIGYFLYKSPQMAITNGGDPYDYVKNMPNQRFSYQYSLPSIGLKVEF